MESSGAAPFSFSFLFLWNFLPNAPMKKMERLAKHPLAPRLTNVSGCSPGKGSASIMGVKCIDNK